ncbi:phage GP46 family protein [Pseudomonas sp. RW3S2]|uniref:phage GP46 family protein n=1 Tax=Pseudomonas sp. RW3S2 TaxID=485884 RepID=UPI0016471EF8|nr:phage GP46 family protein [Pseudomonas sp. RW3S2]MBC3420521.1 phage GP46 family protein [Pseudomonas sp. RW3S2]
MQLFSDDGSEQAWQRAVVISLLTWRRAEDGDQLDDDQRYGWWGDTFPTVERDRIGSRLWQLRRRTLTDDTVRDAEAFARESLAWLDDDDRVATVTVTASREVTRLNLQVVLSMPDGSVIDVQLDKLWQVINAV